MNIIELSKIAKEGDKLKSSIYQNAVCVWKNGVVYSGGSQINLWPLLQSEWEIIPPEPEVFSAQEMYNERREQFITKNIKQNSIGGHRYGYFEGFDDGKQQGRLEMWLAFEKFYNESESFTSFCDAFKKLKPNQSPEN